MNKMCGNCGKTDHKYEDCPYIDMQFPLTKKEYTELKEKARKWDSWPEVREILRNQKLRELIEKRIEFFKDESNCFNTKDKIQWLAIRTELQKLLEDSKHGN